MKTFAKILEAFGIAEVLLGLIIGLLGDMWKELYLAIAGVIIFLAGWILEKRAAGRAATRLPH